MRQWVRMRFEFNLRKFDPQRPCILCNRVREGVKGRLPRIVMVERVAAKFMTLAAQAVQIFTHERFSRRQHASPQSQGNVVGCTKSASQQYISTEQRCRSGKIVESERDNRDIRSKPNETPPKRSRHLPSAVIPNATYNCPNLHTMGPFDFSHARIRISILRYSIEYSLPSQPSSEKPPRW